MPDTGKLAPSLQRPPETRHAALRRALPRARALAAKVASIHGPHNPKLVPLAAEVEELWALLEPHLDWEEGRRLPALAASPADPLALGDALAVMHADHDAMGSALEQIRDLSDGYTTPDWGCTSYRALMAELQAVADEIGEHVRIAQQQPAARDDANEAAAEAPAPGPLQRLLGAEHRQLEALLDRAVADPGRFDHVAFQAFRAGLLRHIAVEEKVLLKHARNRRGGEPLPMARALRVEHGALASLVVPTPDADIVEQIRLVLRVHNRREEGPGGLYAVCERLAGSDVEPLCRQARAVPPVPVAPHFDGNGVHRRAASALRAACKAAPPRGRPAT